MKNNKISLNTLYPNWKAGQGIFHYLDAYNVPWKNAINVQQLDWDYHGNRSGSKIASPLLVSLISDETGIAEQDKQTLAGLLFNKYNHKWSRLFSSLSLFDDVDPLYNVIEHTEQTKELEGSYFNKANQGAQTNTNTQGEQNNSSTIGQQQNSSTQGQQENSSTQGEQNNSSTQGSQSNSSTQGSQSNSSTQGEQNNTSTQGQQSNSKNQGQQNNSEEKKLAAFNSSNYSNDGTTTTTIGSRADSETIGSRNDSNKIGSRSDSETIGQREDSETIGSRSDTNTIGSRSDSQTIGQREDSQTIGQREDSQTIGSRSDSSVIGAKEDTFDNTHEETETTVYDRKANIGVTTTGQLIEDYRVSVSWEFYEKVFEDIDEVLTLPMYVDDFYSLDEFEIVNDYKLPIASSNILGGVKVGNNLSIDSNGVLSAQVEAGDVQSVNGKTGVVVLGASDVNAPSKTSFDSLKNRTDSLEEDVDDLQDDKQDKLTAGTNITIENNVISASGGAVSSVNGQTGDVVIDLDSLGAASQSDLMDAEDNITNLQTGKQDKLPQGQLGKFLKYGTSGEMWSDLNELPNKFAGDEGKYLKLDNDLQPIWAEGQGGGSSEPVLLYSSDTDESVLTLSQPYTNFKYLMLCGRIPNNDVTFRFQSNYYVPTLSVTIGGRVAAIGIYSDNDYCWLKVTDETTLTKWIARAGAFVDRVYGIN